MKKWLAIACIAGLTAGCAATHKIRYPAARWVDDSDKKPIAIPPARHEYTAADVVNYQALYQLERAIDIPLQGEHALHALGFSTLQEALDLNNFDEVADSTWFTNRLGRRPMDVAELRRGPNVGAGPDPAGPWTVVNAKTEGASPGMVIEDANGDRYVLKFDPVGYPELNSGAEIIGTKVMYAMGYNLPENYLVVFHPRILKISPKATTKDEVGKIQPFSEADLTDLFRRIAEHGGGSYQALASKFVAGKVLGPFPQRGKRRHDANDHIPHEHRRELRGYRVFAAFLNNADTKESNSLDSFVVTGPEEKGYVKHYLLDMSNSLGSQSSGPKEKAHLHDYKINMKKIGASLFTLGVYQPNWDKYEDPNLDSVGMFESKYFEPEKWRPTNPNPAFMNMTGRDAFWATKILMRLSNADIRTIVEEAHYTDPRATEYVIKTLIERRDKIGNYYFRKINPLDDFQISSEAGTTYLKFDDLMIGSELMPEGSAQYRYRVIQDRGAYDLLPWTSVSATRIPLDSELLDQMKPGKFYLIQIQTLRSDSKFYTPSVDAIVKKEGELRIWGLNRRYH